MSRVTKKDFHGEIHTIAVAYNQLYDGIDIDLAENVRIIHYDTRKEAMQAVRDGRADACYIYTYMAEKFINQNPDGELIFHIVNKPAIGLSIGICPTTDHELISILNKCLKADQSTVMDELVEKYTSYEQPDVKLAQFVKNNPWVLVALISIVVGVGAIILLIARNNSVLRSVAKERQIFADSLQENDNAEYKAGQLFLSYPSIESYIISNFSDITDLRFRLGKDAKAYIGNNEDIQLNKISDNTLLNAAVEFLKYPENEKLTFDIDDFSAASHEVFSRQENEYLSGKGFRLFSMLTLAFLQMGIIETKQVIE